MPFLSLTRLRLRSRIYVLTFAWRVWTSCRQPKPAPGFLRGSLGRDPDGGFRTMTLWTDEAAMRQYRAAGAHRQAMPKLLDWRHEAAVAHWERDGEALLTGEEARDRMVQRGRVSKVRHPTAAHAARQTVPGGRGPRWGASFHARGDRRRVIAGWLLAYVGRPNSQCEPRSAGVRSGGRCDSGAGDPATNAGPHTPKAQARHICAPVR